MKYEWKEIRIYSNDSYYTLYTSTSSTKQTQITVPASSYQKDYTKVEFQLTVTDFLNQTSSTWTSFAITQPPLLYFSVGSSYTLEKDKNKNFDIILDNAGRDNT
jgi:hypothetical protein